MLVANHRRRRRKGSALIELLLVTPLLLAIIGGLVEFSQMLAAREALTAASREGARAAALGANAAEVEQAARLVLGQGLLSNAQVVSVLTDSNGNPLLPGAPVQVTVFVASGQVAPDVLGMIGLGFRGQILIGSTTMRKE